MEILIDLEEGQYYSKIVLQAGKYRERSTNYGGSEGEVNEVRFNG